MPNETIAAPLPMAFPVIILGMVVFPAFLSGVTMIGPGSDKWFALCLLFYFGLGLAMVLGFLNGGVFLWRRRKGVPRYRLFGMQKTVALGYGLAATLWSALLIVLYCCSPHVGQGSSGLFYVLGYMNAALILDFVVPILLALAFRLSPWLSLVLLLPAISLNAALFCASPHFDRIIGSWADMI